MDINELIRQNRAAQGTIKEQYEAGNLGVDKSPTEEIMSLSMDMVRSGYDKEMIDIASRQKDPQAFIERWRAAETYAEHFGITPSQAFDMVETLSEEYFTKKPIPKTVPRLFVDSVKAANLSNELGTLMSRYMGHGSQFDVMGLSKLGSKERDEVLQKAMDIRKQMMELQVDIMPKHWLRSWAKAMGSTLPYTFEVVKSGVVAGAATSLAGATLGVSGAAWFPAVKSFIATTTQFTRSAEIMRGLEFLELTENGIPEAQATAFANLSAYFSAAVESLLGIESGIGAALGSGVVNSFTQKIVNKMHISGFIKSAATKAVARSVVGTFGEMGEEGLQALGSGFVKMAVETLQEDGVPNPTLWSDVFSDMWDSMVSAATTAPFLGAFSSVAGYLSDKRLAKDVASAATLMPKKEFEEFAKSSGAFKGVGISEDLEVKLIGEVWDSQVSKKAQAVAEAAKEITAAAKAGKTTGTVAREEDGSLYVQERSLGRSGNTEEYVFTSGQKGTETSYGYVGFTVDFSKNSVNLGEASFDTGYEGLAIEVIDRIAARFPGMDIQIQENSMDANLRGAYEGYIEKHGTTNPYKMEQSLTESEADRKFRQKLTDAGITEPTVVEPLVNFKRVIDSITGLEDTHGGLNITSDKSPKGAFGHWTVTDVAGFVNGLKSRVVNVSNDLIKSGKNAQVLETLMHEMTHDLNAVLVQMAPEKLKKIGGIYGIEESKIGDIKSWDAEVMELFVNDFMEYLRGKENPKTDSFFEAIANFFKSIFTSIADRLPPEVRQSFDELFGQAFESQRSVNTPDPSTIKAGVTKDRYFSHPDIKKSVRKDRMIKYLSRMQGVSEEEASRIFKNVEVDARKALGAISAMYVRAVQAGKDALRADLFNATQRLEQAIKKGIWINDRFTLSIIQSITGNDKAFKDAGEYLSYIQVMIDSAADLYGSQVHSSEITEIITELYNSGDYNITTNEVIQEAAVIAYGNSPVSNSILFNEPNPDPRQDAGPQARSYDKFEDWINALYKDPSKVTPEEMEFHKKSWEFAHGKNDVKRRFENKGDFTKHLATGNNFRDFIYHMAKIIRDAKSDTNREEQASRIQAAISKSPEIKRLVDEAVETGKGPSEYAKKRALSEVGKYEALYKYLMAVTEADENLAFEAMQDLNQVPELLKKDLLGNKSRTIQDQKQILDDLRGTELEGKLADGSITIDEVREYIEKNRDFEEKIRKDYEKSAKEEAKMQSEAWKEKFAEYKEKLKAINAAKKLEREMVRLKKQILTPPSSRVDLRHASVILAIQELIEKGLPVTPEELARLKSAASFAFMKDPSDGETILAYQPYEQVWVYIASITSKGDGSWSRESLEDIADFIHYLSQAGRAERRKQEFAFGLIVKATRKNVMDEFRSMKHYVENPHTPGSEEYKNHERKMAIKSIQYAADRPDAWFKKYLGKGAYKVLFQEEVAKNRQRLTHYDRRVKEVNDFIAANKMASDKKLFRKLTINNIGPRGSSFTITGSELIGISLLIGDKENFNQNQRDAFIFGNLFDHIEKDSDGNIADGAQTPENFDDARLLAEGANNYLKSQYQEKLDKLLAFVKENITDEEKELGRIMAKAMDNNADWYRFASAIYELTNKEPMKEKFYFPLVRTGEFLEGEDAALDAMKRMDFHAALNQGMSIIRKEIQPRNQRPVKYDALSVFYDSIAKQEHLTVMGPYIKQLRGIFLNSTLGASLLDDIRHSLGQEGVDVLKNYIDTITNPNAFKEKASGDKMLSMFRGSMVIANLAWRWSSVGMQMMTSVLPGLQEAPLELLKVTAEAYTNPLNFYKTVEEKSPILKHRQLMPEQAIIRERIERGLGTTIEKIGQAGMQGLVWADRHSVAIVWEAVRRKQFDKRYRALSDADKANPNRLEFIEMEARAYADEHIIKTQPTSEEQYRASMYRDPNAFKQVILQFTQPLNVIYNNIRHDMPEAVREQEYGKAIGILTAYAMSGFAVSAIAVLRGRGPDEPDEEKWARYWLHASTSQFTDSIPFIGQIVTSLTGYAIVGDNESWLRNDTNMPAVDLLARSVEGLIADEKNWGKIAWNAAKGIGMMAGAPMRAVEEYYKLGAKAFGQE